MLSQITDLRELGDSAGSEDKMNNVFYSLSIRADGACLDDNIARSLFAGVNFIDAEGHRAGTKHFSGMDSLTKIISRTNICGRDSAPVYVRIILAHGKREAYTGISLEGPEDKRPITLTWD